GRSLISTVCAGAITVSQFARFSSCRTLPGNGSDAQGVQPAVGAAPAGLPAAVAAPNGAPAGYPLWESGLRTEVARLLRENSADVMDELARRFEAAVIREALDFTRGRKVEAAERLGIGRNTITRKIQELHLEP
ncbi:helix-turn-helix domain-containing protein, partial [Burkholderia pseudomultivorans]|uniref:helix-turn-helix domain-containing protein n=1 Tax=Burkholderia pseudomultivorans TaxID=1207504 RepID=UPI002B271731